MARCASAESAKSSPEVARKPSRPSKVLLDEEEILVVTVEGKQDVLLTTRDDYKQMWMRCYSPFVCPTSCSMSGTKRCPTGRIVCCY